MAEFGDILVCPVCGGPLPREGKSVRCPKGHSYDVAREGYVNLLSPKTSREIPGDSPEMVRARRAFFGTGAYAPLEEALEAEVASAAKRLPRLAAGVRVLDAGCGEGRALRAAARVLGSLFGPERAAAFGFDVSKAALRMAASAHPEGRYFAADTRGRLPVADGSADLLLDLFAPRNMPEFARVLAPDGAMVVVVPKEDHLAGLRAAVPLIGIHAGKERTLLEQTAPFFGLEVRRDVEFPLELTPESAAALVAMTPSARHLSPADFSELERKGPPEARASLRLFVFRRRL